MGYIVEVDKPCRCFLRDGMVDEQEFATKEEAKAEAERMVDHMENNFCNAHSFSVQERMDGKGFRVIIG